MSCIFLFGFLYNTEAQEDEIVTVKTYISQDGVHPGDTFKVALLLNISPGWHINAPELSDPYLIPTELIVEETNNIKVLKLYYPEPNIGKFDYSETELSLFEGEVIFGALIRASENIARKKHTLIANLLYQACDHQTCTFPKTLELEIPFEVVSSSEKAEEINKKIFSKISFDKESR